MASESVVYIPRYDEHNSVHVVGRVDDQTGAAEYIRRDRGIWEEDATGIFYRRLYDSTDPWIPEAEARMIVESWGFDFWTAMRPPPDHVTPARLASFAAAIVLGRPKSDYTLTPAESAAWDRIVPEVEQLRADGITVDMPFDFD